MVKKMWKKYVTAMAVICLAAWMLTACGSKKADTAAEETAAQTEAVSETETQEETETEEIIAEIEEETTEESTEAETETETEPETEETTEAPDYAELGLNEEAVEYGGITIHMPEAFRYTETDANAYAVLDLNRCFDSVTINTGELAVDFSEMTRESMEENARETVPGFEGFESHEQFEIDGAPAILTTYKRTMNGVSLDARDLIIDMGGSIVEVIALDQTGEYAAQLKAALDSVRISPEE